MGTTFVVAFYESDRAYGGGEEGGWWYDTGQLIRVFKTFKTEHAAYDCARRANCVLDVVQRGNRSINSILYNGGRYVAQVYANIAPRYYPETKPRYE